MSVPGQDKVIPPILLSFTSWTPATDETMTLLADEISFRSAYPTSPQGTGREAFGWEEATLTGDTALSWFVEGEGSGWATDGEQVVDSRTAWSEDASHLLENTVDYVRQVASILPIDPEADERSEDWLSRKRQQLGPLQKLPLKSSYS